MSNFRDIILNALNYYDVNTEKYNSFIRKIKYYRLEKTFEENELEYNIIIFYDKNKNEYFRSRYELLGGHYRNLGIWTWGWAMGTKKNETISSRKLLNYALDLDRNFQLLKKELITSRFKILYDIQIDIHIAIASYISKLPLTFKLDIDVPNPNETIYPVNSPNSTTSIFIYLLDNPKL